MSRKLFSGVAMGVVLSLLASTAVAQQPGLAPQAAAQPPGGPQAKDRQIAEWIAADNHVKMQIAKLGEEKAKSDKVKEFAATVCEDHKKGNERIAEAVPGAAMDLDRDRADRGVAGQQPVAPGQPVRGTLTADRAHAGLDATATKQKIAKKRVETLKNELKDLDGDKFDAAFLGLQVVKHQNLIATLDVLEEEASGELKSAIAKERETAKDHLSKARELMKDLKDD